MPNSSTGSGQKSSLLTYSTQTSFEYTLHEEKIERIDYKTGSGLYTPFLFITKMDIQYCVVCIILIVTCGGAGFCILSSAVIRWYKNHQEPSLPPLPVRGVMLVQGEPALNISNAIDIIPYRNNTIHPIEIDPIYIQIEVPKVGEKEFHPAAYAFMV